MERCTRDAEPTLEEEPMTEPARLPDWVGMLEGPGGPWAAQDEELLSSGWAAELEAERQEP